MNGDSNRNRVNAFFLPFPMFSVVMCSVMPGKSSIAVNRDILEDTEDEIVDISMLADNMITDMTE